MADAAPPIDPTLPADAKPAPLPCPYLDPENAPLPKSGWLRKWPGVTYLLPFAAFMLVGMIEPAPPDPKVQTEIARLSKEAEDSNLARSRMAREELEKLKTEQHHLMPYEYYPYVYTLKIALTTLAILVVIPGYIPFGFRVHGIAWVVGAVGTVVWIVLAKLQVATYPYLPGMASSLLEMGGRAGFNPLVELKDNPTWAWGFLAIRLFGFVIVVAIIEEFFLRGFLARYVMDIDWPLIPFAVVNRLALISLIAFPVLSHPERLAAAAWFGMITWLMLKTKSIWDCIVAHAVTNLLLALWVIYSGEWWLM